MKRVVKAARTTRMSEATHNDWIYLRSQIEEDVSNFIAAEERKYDRMFGTDPDMADPEIVLQNLRDAHNTMSSVLTDYIISGAE